ncbi:MAG: hypothetical protein KDJ77_02050 [Rhodobiaceae bacterium]|nr:hypothetical protein [Rhodobiaceae bacterium]
MSLADRPGIAASFVAARRNLAIADRATLIARQETLLDRLRRKTLPASPYFAEYRDRPFDDWPVIDKSVWMANFDRINTVGLRRGEALAVAERAERERDFAPTLRGITVGLSTGTSGQRGLFLVSPGERRQWAGVVLAALLRGNSFAPRKVAFLLRANSNLYRTAATGPVRLRYFDMLQPWPSLVGSLRAFRPDVLIGPAGTLALLAREGGLAPRQVVSVAETLHDDDAARIHGAFGVLPEQVYQATEGVLALPCRMGRLHLNEAYMRIETDWIDRPSRRFAPIVTDLCRHTQPVLRYRLDDIVMLDDEPCPCGTASRVVQRIEGRCDDICRFLTPDGATVPVFPDFLTRTVMASTPDLVDYQIRQTRPGALVLVLPSGATPPPTIGSALFDLAGRLGAVPPDLAFEHGLEHAAKRRRVVCVKSDQP